MRSATMLKAVAACGAVLLGAAGATAQGLPPLRVGGFNFPDEQTNQKVAGVPGVLGAMKYVLYVPSGYSPADTTKTHPLLVYLHGAEDGSVDGRSMLTVRRTGSGPAALLKRMTPAERANFPYFVVFPQSVTTDMDAGGNTTADWAWDSPDGDDTKIVDQVTAIVGQVANRYPIDTRRVALSGFSRGARTAWTVAATRKPFPARDPDADWAAIVSVAGWSEVPAETLRRVVRKGPGNRAIPCYLFLSLDDEYDFVVGGTRDIWNAVRTDALVASGHVKKLFWPENYYFSHGDSDLAAFGANPDYNGQNNPFYNTNPATDMYAWLDVQLDL